MSVKPGKLLKVRVTKKIPQLTAGNYFVIAEIDPADIFHDSNFADNLIVSPAPAVMVS